VSESKSVILNGQVLHGSDRLGNWRTTLLDGWFDGPPVRLTDEARPTSDGDFDLPSTYGSRLITIGGRVVCTSEGGARQAGNRLTGLLLPAALVKAHVTDTGEQTWARVKLADKPTVKRVGKLIRFQYQLKAPNPRRFGEKNSPTITTAAPATITQRGNYPATPKFTVSGSMPGGYTLTVDGRNYTVTVPLVNGSPHVIDYNDGRLRIGGTIRQNSLGNTNLATIPVGRPVTVTLTPGTTGTGSAVMDLYDTYI
jgi:hypothetical protein